jgi:O-antigen/teichoic acid export membrane protein
MTIGQICARAINMVTHVILARWLSPDGYGQYSMIVTYIVLFGVIGSLGMNYITNRFVARDQENSRKYLKICLILRFGGFAIVVLSLLIYNLCRDVPLVDNILYSILLGVFLESIWSSLQSIEFGMQHMEWNSLMEVLTALFTVVIYLLLQAINPSAVTVRFVVIVYLSLLVVKNFSYYFILEKKNLITHKAKDAVKSADIKTVFMQGFPFYIMAVVGLFTNQFPILFLEQHAGLEEVAYFNTANKLLLPLTILLSTALTAIFPNQAKLYVSSKTQYWKQVKKMFMFMVIVGGFIALGVSIFRNELVLFLFGEKYASTGNVMAFQSWYILLFALFSLNGNALGASDRQKILSVESIVFALVTTPIIYYASYHGAEGLSIGYCIASVFNLLFLFSILVKISQGGISVKYILLMFSFLSFQMALSFILQQSHLLILKVLLIISYILSLFVINNKKMVILDL